MKTVLTALIFLVFAFCIETTGGETRYYIYGLGLIGHEQGGTYRTYHFDPRGNTIALTKDDGSSITDRFEYSPYGETIYRAGATQTPFRFNGMLGVYTDTESNLIHMRARYYSPYLKRFIRRDPIGFEGGMNHYAFAAGNPISFADPSGLGPIGNSSFGQGFNTGFEAGQNLLSPIGNLRVNTGNMIFGHLGIVWQLAHGNIGDAGRLILGIPLSIASGDSFFQQSSVDSSGNSFFTNGILNRFSQARAVAEGVTSQTGRPTQLIYNPTTYLGDFLQILGGELKIPTVSSLWVAQALAGSTAGHVHAYGHSQGGNVLSLALSLLPQGISYQTTTFGAQTFVNGGANLVAPGDIVPTLSPWNLGNHGQTTLPIPNIGFPGSHGAGNYIPHIRP